MPRYKSRYTLIKEYVISALVGASVMAGIGTGFKEEVINPNDFGGVATIEVYDKDGNLKRTSDPIHNLVPSAGGTELLKILTGQSDDHFDFNAQLGVGNSATAPNANDTDLNDSGAEWVSMDAGFPDAVASNAVFFRATFGTDIFNSDTVNEIGLRNPTSGVLLSHITNGGSGWGAKGASEIWVIKLKFSIAATGGG